MTWLEHHNISEHYAQLAEQAMREQNPPASQEYYVKAAQAELLALRSLEPGKARTLGITVVSAVALLLKANDFRQAERLACTWLATDELPTVAIEQLRQLLAEIWQKTLPTVVAG